MCRRMHTLSLPMQGMRGWTGGGYVCSWYNMSMPLHCFAGQAQDHWKGKSTNQHLP